MELTDVLFPWSSQFKWRPWDLLKYSEMIAALGRGKIESLAARWLQNFDESFTLFVARAIYKEVRRDVERYPSLAAFQADWVIIRTFVPLQLRLAVEQYCYGKGGQWKSISTGFKPVDVAGALLAPTGGQSSGDQNRGSKRGRALSPEVQRRVADRKSRYHTGR